MSARDFSTVDGAADVAHEAASIAHDVFAVVSIALSSKDFVLTADDQNALWTVARYGVQQAKEARDAIELAGNIFRLSR